MGKTCLSCGLELVNFRVTPIRIVMEEDQIADAGFLADADALLPRVVSPAAIAPADLIPGILAVENESIGAAGEFQNRPIACRIAGFVVGGVMDDLAVVF